MEIMVKEASYPDDIAAQKSAEDAERLTEQEAREFKKLLMRFVKSYGKKPAEISDQAWLKNQFLAELPGISDEDAEKKSAETIATIVDYNSTLASINESCAKGVSTESWFAKKSAEMSAGLSVEAYGTYLSGIDAALNDANLELSCCVRNKFMQINQSSNLDGFIAEQELVNTFNMRAALEKSGFHAEVVKPKPGTPYHKNSFDIVIKDRAKGTIIHQHQVKYGADSQATIRLIKAGNYNNQRIVVPVEQVSEVQKAFPGKTITGHIGGTDRVPTKSDGLTKQDAKRMQKIMQADDEVLVSKNWNSYNTKELAKNIGKQAAFSGVQAAALATGLHLAGKVISGEPVDAEEVVKVALETGVDTGVKAAAAGALVVSVERGICPSIVRDLPIPTLARIACVSIENIKILYKVATGELTVLEGLDQMGRTSAAMTYGMIWGGVGTAVAGLLLAPATIAVGTVALATSGAVGLALCAATLAIPVVGGLVGGIIGYAAGSEFGKAVYEGGKKIVKGAVSVVKAAWECGEKALNSIGHAIGNSIFNPANWF